MTHGAFIKMTDEAMRSFATDHDADAFVEKMVNNYLDYLYRQIDLLEQRIHDEDRHLYKHDSLVEEVRLINKTIEGLENANIGAIT